MPVMMTQKAMKSKEDYYEVLVDSKTPCENVTRFAQSQGYKVEVEEKNGEYLLKISK
jgi:TusA-related sulfurtransferase